MAALVAQPEFLYFQKWIVEGALGGTVEWDAPNPWAPCRSGNLAVGIRIPYEALKRVEEHWSWKRVRAMVEHPADNWPDMARRVRTIRRLVRAGARLDTGLETP